MVRFSFHPAAVERKAPQHDHPKARERCTAELEAALIAANVVEAAYDVGALIEQLQNAADAAKTADVDGALLVSAGAALQRLLDKRLEQAQAETLNAARIKLRRAIDEAVATPEAATLARLEVELTEGEESGASSELLAEGRRALSSGGATLLERTVRLAMAKEDERELHLALREARRVAEQRGSGVRLPRKLMDEAESALKRIRRVAQKRNALESVILMSGPAALERALQAARADCEMPSDVLAKAEATLAERQREARYCKWLEALQGAQQRLLDEKHARWRGRRRRQRPADWACPACTFVNNGSMPFCEMCEVDKPAAPPEPPSPAGAGAPADEADALELQQCAALAAEARRRLADPTARPAAWLFFLRTAYRDFPPPHVSLTQLNRARASLEHAAKSRVSRSVPRALMDAIRLYHPDKNPANEYGSLWPRVAEELTKLATLLYAEYRARIEGGAGA